MNGCAVTVKKIKRIAIIGAGPAGISAAKHFIAEGCFDAIDVFEQQAYLGGVWNYYPHSPYDVDVPQTNPHQPPEEPYRSYEKGCGTSAKDIKPRPIFITPMYDRLESNLPHFLMKYSDDPSLEDLPLFARHELVLQYLDTYGSEIRHLVKFQTQVHDVRQVSHDEKEGWLVCSRNVLSNEANEGHYDAVAVASGHYSVPTLPDIPGIKQWNEAYPRVITHSKSYRSPDAFTSQKVMIIGNSASGLDIAAQVGSVSKLPVIVSRRSETSLSLKSNTDWKLERPEIIEFLSPANDTRAVKFVDGTVESRIDRIVFCTGYYFSFPFFSSVKPPFITTGERVENLYKHLFSIDHPTIAFLGVPTKIVPFRTCEGQAAVVARVWSSRLNLPNKLKMKEWEVQRVADCGEGKRFHELKLLEDLAYHNEMVDWAKEASSNGVGRIPPKWSKRDEWTRCKVGAIKAAYMERGEARSSVRSMEELGFSYED